MIHSHHTTRGCLGLFSADNLPLSLIIPSHIPTCASWKSSSQRPKKIQKPEKKASDAPNRTTSYRAARVKAMNDFEPERR